MASAIAADGALLTPHERAAIEASMGALTQTLNGTDHRAIKTAVEALNRATEAFAAKRMDASICKALTGQKLADIGT